ncbi:endonuclease/exonuclease/phosphatase family protein [Streptomyces lunaelactis]|uniref:endonuclease/exonuclease/phosphatase family protein n=1 Tax=Streptomyces lunaelactis TaxID=1535768 RepID=UPI0015853940|nr:endonuclease/exonuclease/phosphatase family protein [Streptomyces lunaelactis]NUK09952.1 endonuclease/exonuclease/phosphatase family protein [Streptomyces lunaelactis]NUK72738.1 endonuclease/exonuclease/phosphatase family protein [Streptomyces lunaelactis]NUL11416.1 endonuclease/exonuclease/phosphatase family protein [Streptomyces lunaelactis]NUL25341.1 endonuclease/exonuclease/phosphatase family protein [Streptomyces lunaelactis]
MELTIAVQNLGHGGLRNGSGDPEHRWPQLAERINSAAERVGARHVDLALVQEAVDWDKYGHRQLGQAMTDLDMDAVPIPPSSSGYPPTLLYRRETLGRWTHWNTDFTRETLHGFGVAVFDVGLPAPLAVVSAHLNPFVADKARDEVKLVATRALRYGPYGIVAGDMNYPPADPASPSPDYAAMLPYNKSARTRLPSEADGQLVPDRRVTEMLAYTGFVDAAAKLYEEHGDKELLRKTATDDRIDQLWVSAPLRDTVVAYALLDTPEGASDHHGLVVRVDLERAATDNVWEYK